MKLLETAHGYFETGSDIADAVIQCHRERCAAFRVDSIVVPFRDGMGVPGSVRIMVGRPYAIGSASISSRLPELRDPVAVARILEGEGDDAFDDMASANAEFDRLEYPIELAAR